MFTPVRCSDTKEELYCYEDYLKSQHWIKIRERYINKYGERCEACGEIGKELHHLKYDTLGNESFDDLMLLCENCHLEEHKSLKEEFNL